MKSQFVETVEKNLHLRLENKDSMKRKVKKHLLDVKNAKQKEKSNKMKQLKMLLKKRQKKKRKMTLKKCQKDSEPILFYLKKKQKDVIKKENKSQEIYLDFFRILWYYLVI